MSTVDVVVPCYNYGRFLETCIRSILEQDGVSVRALVIDDASSDDSSAVAQRLAGLDARVSFRRHDRNSGHIAIYNEGLLEWAEADYVLLISADDVVAPGAFDRAARVLDGDPGVGLCVGREIVFCDEVPYSLCVNSTAVEGSIIEGRQLIEMACNAGDNPIPTPTAMVRTALQKRIGGYEKELPHTADLDMWLRFAAKGRVGVRPAVRAFKREHSANMLKQYTPKILPDLRQRLLAFESAFAEIGDEIRNPDVLLGKAKQNLSAQAFWGAHALFERGDTALVQQLLDLAVELDSELRGSPRWQRFVWKRRIGPEAWRVVGSVVSSLRGIVRPVS